MYMYIYAFHLKVDIPSVLYFGNIRFALVDKQFFNTHVYTFYPRL